MGVVLAALALGGVVLLLALGVPRTGGGIAGSVAIALAVVAFAAAAVSSIYDGMALQGRHVHIHDRGLLAETKEGPLPLPYADLLVYREQIDHKKGTTTMYTVVNWWIERRDGTPWKVAPEAAGGLQDLFEATLAKACEAQAVPQAAALAEGATLSYGDVTFDGHRLKAPGVDAAWSDVKAVDAARGTVTVLLPRDGRLVKEVPRPVGTVGKIPNFPLFWPLFQQAFDRSRPGASASATADGRGLGERDGPVPPTEGSSGSGSSGSRSS